MRLLHTSDWHLGRSLHRADLREAQERYLDHLVEVVGDERIDVVLVSGDVYDRALPSVDAVRLCHHGLVRLAATGARVVVISGNHDSAHRLGFGNELIDHAGVHLRTDPARVGTPLLLPDAGGRIAVYGVPYLEPEAVRDMLPEVPLGAANDAAPGAPFGADRLADGPVDHRAGGAVDRPAGGPAAADGPVDGVGGRAGRRAPGPHRAGRGHAGVLARAMAAVRADLADRPGVRSVVLAHAWISGGEACASERDITVGGVAQAPASLFAGVDYVALGHLHGAQTLAPGLRYSGSPLPYSFSEAAHVKGSWLVELGASGLGAVEFVPAPAYRRLTVLTGTLEDLLASPEHDGHRDDFLSVVLTDTVRPDDPMRRLQARFPHTLTLEWRPAGAAPSGETYAARVRGRADLDIAAAFVEHVRRSPAEADERDLLAAAFEAGRLAAAGA